MNDIRIHKELAVCPEIRSGGDWREVVSDLLAESFVALVILMAVLEWFL